MVSQLETNMELEEFSKIFPPYELLKIIMYNSFEILWVFNVKTMRFECSIVDEEVSGLIPVNMRKSVLGERIAVEDRDRMISAMTTGIELAEREKRHVKIQSLNTTHTDGRGHRKATQVSMHVYYDDALNRATYVVGDTRVSYKEPYKKILMKLLSARERECMDLVFDGKSQKEISRIMNVNESTVSNYKANIEEKTELTIDELIELYV